MKKSTPNRQKLNCNLCPNRYNDIEQLECHMLSHPEVVHFELQLIDLEVPTDREGTEVRHSWQTFLL